jgi:hypothetical protein
MEAYEWMRKYKSNLPEADLDSSIETIELCIHMLCNNCGDEYENCSKCVVRNKYSKTLKHLKKTKEKLNES